MMYIFFLSPSISSGLYASLSWLDDLWNYSVLSCDLFGTYLTHPPSISSRTYLIIYAYYLYFFYPLNPFFFYTFFILGPHFSFRMRLRLCRCWCCWLVPLSFLFCSSLLLYFLFIVLCCVLFSCGGRGGLPRLIYFVHVQTRVSWIDLCPHILLPFRIVRRYSFHLSAARFPLHHSSATLPSTLTIVSLGLWTSLAYSKHLPRTKTHTHHRPNDKRRRNQKKRGRRRATICHSSIIVELRSRIRTPLPMPYSTSYINIYTRLHRSSYDILLSVPLVVVGSYLSSLCLHTYGHVVLGDQPLVTRYPPSDMEDGYKDMAKKISYSYIILFSLSI